MHLGFSNSSAFVKICFFTIYSSKSNSSPISQVRIIVTDLKDLKNMVARVHTYKVE